MVVISFCKLLEGPVSPGNQAKHHVALLYEDKAVWCLHPRLNWNGSVRHFDSSLTLTELRACNSYRITAIVREQRTALVFVQVENVKSV